jgi:hypothetical protein
VHLEIISKVTSRFWTLAGRGAPADGIRDDIYVQDENGGVVPYVLLLPGGSLAREDHDRDNKSRDRPHTRVWYVKQLLAIIEGKLVLSKEKYRAFITFGRLRGWNRRSPSKR